MSKSSRSRVFHFAMMAPFKVFAHRRLFFSFNKDRPSMQIRQAEALEETTKASGTITDEQKEKISKLLVWRQEEAAMEKQLQQTAS